MHISWASGFAFKQLRTIDSLANTVGVGDCGTRSVGIWFHRKVVRTSYRHKLQRQILPISIFI
jgi:hypothetical protein